RFRRGGAGAGWRAARPDRRWFLAGGGVRSWLGARAGSGAALALGPERCSPSAWADAHPWSGPGPRPWPSPALALGPGRRSPLARSALALGPVGARPWPGPGSSLAWASAGPWLGPVLTPRPGPPVPRSRPLRPAS